MNLIDMLETYPILRQKILNIYLVSKGARKATLLEHENFSIDEKEQEQYFNIIKQYVSHLNLILLLEDRTYNRYLVSNIENIIPYILDKTTDPDIKLGKILGFLCPGLSSVHMDEKGKTSGFIWIIYKNEKINITAELCAGDDVKSMEKHTSKKANMFRSVLPKEISVNYDVLIEPSLKMKQKKIEQKDYDFVLKNLDDYENDIFNIFESKKLCKRFVKDMNERKNIESYIIVYDFFYDDKWMRYMNYNLEMDKRQKDFQDQMIILEERVLDVLDSKKSEAAKEKLIKKILV